MKRIINYLILFALAFSITSCLRTIYPLLEHKNYMKVELKLIGKWLAEDGVGVFKIDKYYQDTLGITSNEYKITYFEKSKDSTKPERSSDTVVFRASIGKIGQRFFLQLTPDNFEKSEYLHNKPLLWSMNIIQGYTFYQIWIDDDSFSLSSPNNDWIIDQVRKYKIDLEIYPLTKKDFATILSNTKKLRAFCLKYANNSNAFNSKMKYTRSN